MKEIFLIGVLTAALFPVGLQNNSPGRPFSVASLRGTCVWQSVGYPTTSGEQASVGPATILAGLTFDGNGQMSLAYDVNLNGTYSSESLTGEYSVDSTGHGEFSFTSPASGYTLTYDFRLSPNGRVLYTMVKSYSGLTVTPRVSAGACNFHE